MRDEKERVPKLRFPGFTEPWEQSKIHHATFSSSIDTYINIGYNVNK